MELNEQLRKYRKQNDLTQRELALKLNVSDKTISSWETGRTYPDISMLINLSSILKVSLDEFLKGDFETVQKIDKDLKLKRVYKKWLIAILVLVFAIGGSFYFLSTYQYKNVMVDRFNPLLETEIGYAALPTEKTAIASDYEIVKDSHGKTKKILGSPYKNMVVTDNAWGDSSFLTFYGGLAPKNKPYAMVKHRVAMFLELILSTGNQFLNLLEIICIEIMKNIAECIKSLKKAKQNIKVTTFQFLLCRQVDTKKLRFAFFYESEFF